MSTVSTPQALAGPPSPLYELVWADEFDGTAVDTSKWHHRTDVKGWSSQRPENVTIGDGLMTVHLRKERHRGMDYTGGGLVSTVPFRYGYYETRMKANAGSGWHPAFWTGASDGTTTFPDYSRTEIDGFEIDTHQTHRTRHNIWLWLPGQDPDGPEEAGGRAHAPVITSGVYDLGFDTAAEFHTYGFEWTEDQVKYYVDSVLMYTASYPPLRYTQHDYANVWLSVLAIGFQGSPGVDDTALPAQVQWEYFRYYAKDSYTDNDGPSATRYGETGTWHTGSLPGHTLENTSRYSEDPGATATWRGWLPAAGTYDVYAYTIAHPDGDTNARYDVDHGDGTATALVNTRTGPTGWRRLGGPWPFAAGDNGLVTLTRGDGIAWADAVKFVRVS
ncbi:family 16 glycosylhydrolase [Jiangella asiatica]|uniref:Glycosyl hydrolase family protein n=1 Tax=Jiangella asiatica TaxID=2530372 RepID=A0A4V2Z0Y7_9ACTN|nr:family 16 glycosylhydrolase [Jiangella asiatica]TDE02788.1 glycosyl hydrolase family protein [Jiangella asiatica]